MGGWLTWILDVDQERDITTNPEWERLYQYEIPVLAKVLPDGTEVSLALALLSDSICSPLAL